MNLANWSGAVAGQSSGTFSTSTASSGTGPGAYPELRPGRGPGAGAGAGAGAGGRGRGSEGMGKPESGELDANSLKSGRAGQGTGQGNLCELDANSRKSANASNSSSHGQKSSPPSLFADLSELASNSQDSDLGATQPAPAPGLALHPSDLGLPKPSPALSFVCSLPHRPSSLPQPSARPPAPHASSACFISWPGRPHPSQR